jgi:hypothetical protein
MGIEAVLPQPSVEAFQLGVTRRLAATAEAEFKARLIG